MKTKSILLFTLVILTITATIKAQNIPSYIPTNGLVGWWPFNGNANDESGNGFIGVANGATMTWDRFGASNAAYSFDGVDDFIQSNHNLNDLSAFSISIFIDFINVGNGGHFVQIGWDQVSGSAGDPTCNGYGVGSGNGQTNVFGSTLLGLASCINWYPTSFNFTTNDSWQHLIITKVNSNVNYYVNGIQVSSSSINNIFNPSNNLFFGSASPNYGNFNGKLDDIAIWNRALSAQEITALYTASSTNNNATSNTTANVPGSISYQAVARDAQGMPLADANLQVQFTLIADSLSGTAEYVETHTLTTNSLGLFTTAFGAGTPVSNTFGNINWSAGNKFLQVQIDTGNGWIDMGTQQLLSTPYSMHSATSGAIKNPGLPVFADNAAALAGGLVVGDMYRTSSGDLKIVY